jgi:hypothetical protein
VLLVIAVRVDDDRFDDGVRIPVVSAWLFGLGPPEHPWQPELPVGCCKHGAPVDTGHQAIPDPGEIEACSS